MKLAVSYFYQIRFFKPYMIPVSTAMYDPKWYHMNKSQDYSFIDNNGVINGLRAPILAPNETCTTFCHGRDYCIDTYGEVKPDVCNFMKNYRIQLNEIDLDALVKHMERRSNDIKSRMGFTEEPIVVLLVHESCDNPCSERNPLIEAFRNKGYEIDELKYPIKENY